MDRNMWDCIALEVCRVKKSYSGSQMSRLNQRKYDRLVMQEYENCQTTKAENTKYIL